MLRSGRRTLVVALIALSLVLGAACNPGGGGSGAPVPGATGPADPGGGIYDY